ncbi:hypothetical protein II906_01295, partial [bacterium]|nr:hypothetical protein [bacterium]
YSERIILRILLMLHRTTDEKEFTKEQIEEEEKNSENVKNILQSNEYYEIFKGDNYGLLQFC